MSSVLYYSNYCEPSKKLLQVIGKTPTTKDMHFICIDNRVKDQNGKLHIVLQNGQKIIMPENVTRVPALMLLNQNYKVVYGDEIYNHIKPLQQTQIKEATKNNMVPQSFQDGFSAFDGFGGGSNISSDNYSFLDQSDDELGVKGNGGLRQMHNYVSLNDSMNFSMNIPQDDNSKNSGKIKEGQYSLEALEKRRNEELSNISYAQNTGQQMNMRK
jgi:hypothetical protein